MARVFNVLMFLMLLALTTFSWGQEAQDDDGNVPPQWTTCNITGPKISCQNCNTRLICKPIGGLVKPCNNPNRPHCNNGICSPVPDPNCV